MATKPTVWVELWADVDRNEASNDTNNRWRCTVWETINDEIDPDGEYFDPEPGHWSFADALRISAMVARELREDGFRVLLQNHFRKHRPRSAKTLKEELGSFSDQRSWRVFRVEKQFEVEAESEIAELHS